MALTLSGTRTPCRNKDSAPFSKSNWAPRASSAPFHSNAGISASSANAVNVPLRPAMPTLISVACLTSPTLPSQKLNRAFEG